jgi:hypothetical protein
LQDYGDTPSAARAPVSRPALVLSEGGGQRTSQIEGSPKFEALNEDIESERLDREESLRVSDVQLERNFKPMFGPLFFRLA